MEYIKNIVCTFIIFLSPLFSGWKEDREKLDYVYIKNEFRIFYTLKGKDALPIYKRDDINKNKIPDFVENIALQLSIADEIYSNVLGFVKPLQSKRYKGKVQAIDVHLLRFKKGNGDSGDGIISYVYKNGFVPNLDVLSITISNTIETSNLTPAHELFHCYQNGYNMFKNRWYTEGTSRWSEFALKKRTGKQNNLPSKYDQVEKLLNKTYNASFFWNRLLFLCSSDDKGFLLPDHLKNRFYIGESQNIVMDDTLFGYSFLKTFFELLDKYDDVVTRDRFLKNYSWKEKEQKSFKNNPYILKALKETVNAYNCKHNKEVKHFIRALNKYLELNDRYKDVSDEITIVGIPFLDRYKSGEDVYARNVWDMQFYNNSIYIAAGNSSNSSPAPNSGPVPIIKYDLDTERFVTEGTVSDEQIALFKVLNERLYIPGHDAMRGHKFGNFYTKQNSFEWMMYSNIPNALHVFDMQYFENKLFAAISTVKGAGIAISDNNGKSWYTSLIGPKQRTYALLIIDKILYAVKQELSSQQKKKLSKEELKNYYLVAEYIDGNFLPRYDLTPRDIFPESNLKSLKRISISKSVIFNENSIYIVSYDDINPFALFIARSFKRGKIDIEKIKISIDCTPRDILIREKELYMLCSKKDKYDRYSSVWKSTIKNFIDFKKVFQFKAPTFARSFEEKDGTFYFGLGCDVKNKKYWKQDELILETGKIIKVKIDKNII